jgi:hypothetical protein
MAANGSQADKPRPLRIQRHRITCSYTSKSYAVRVEFQLLNSSVDANLHRRVQCYKPTTRNAATSYFPACSFNRGHFARVQYRFADRVCNYTATVTFRKSPCKAKCATFCRRTEGLQQLIYIATKLRCQTFAKPNI